MVIALRVGAACRQADLAAPVITHSLTATLDNLIDGAVVLPTLRRGEDERATFRLQLAAAHCAGVAVDWSVLHGRGRLVDPPPITFDQAGELRPGRRPAGGGPVR
ncbi:MAG: hypothetical protein J2P16_01635 [Mycobacterium sp.]|nr:hypothetical protein [Mycobacterium sp.]